MKIISSPRFLKFTLSVILTLTILGFFYFESSWTIRVLLILIGIISLWQVNSLVDLPILICFYLGLYDLYNIRYGLAVPLSVIMVAVLILTMILFLSQIKIGRFPDVDKDLLYVYLVVTGLIILEIFLAMSFWPVDPKIKSLSISVIFYLIVRIIFFKMNLVLSLKRVGSLILISFLILSIVISLNWWLGF